MLTNLIKLEYIFEGKVCQFICNPDTDVKIVKDALCKFMGYVQQVEDMANARKLEEEAKEEIKPLE